MIEPGMLILMIVTISVATLFLALSIATRSSPGAAHDTYVVGMLGHEEITACIEGCRACKVST